MGEIAEMMLDGTMCQSCGEFLGGDEGYPVSCPSCAEDEPVEPDPVYAPVSKAERRSSKRQRKNERYRQMQSIIHRAHNTIEELIADNPPDGIEKLRNINTEMEELLIQIGSKKRNA